MPCFYKCPFWIWELGRMDPNCRHTIRILPCKSCMSHVTWWWSFWGVSGPGRFQPGPLPAQGECMSWRAGCARSECPPVHGRVTGICPGGCSQDCHLQDRLTPSVLLVCLCSWPPKSLLTFEKCFSKVVWFYHSQTECLWTSFLISLSLHLVTIKMGIISITILWGCYGD